MWIEREGGKWNGERRMWYARKLMYLYAGPSPCIEPIKGERSKGGCQRLTVTSTFGSKKCNPSFIPPLCSWWGFHLIECACIAKNPNLTSGCKAKKSDLCKFLHDTHTQQLKYRNGLKFLSFHRKLIASDCKREGTRSIGKISNWKVKKIIPMIPVLPLHIIDQVPIDLSMRWSTAAEYDRPRNTSLLWGRCCKVESGEVNSCRAIQANKTYWKFSDSYAFAAVATNLIWWAFCSPRVWYLGGEYWLNGRMFPVIMNSLGFSRWISCRKLGRAFWAAVNTPRFLRRELRTKFSDPLFLCIVGNGVGARTRYWIRVAW